MGDLLPELRDEKGENHISLQLEMNSCDSRKLSPQYANNCSNRAEKF
jgi:hypothetical protein